MKSKFKQLLHSMNKEQLVDLFEELISHDPTLQAEIDPSLARLAVPVDHPTSPDTVFNSEVIMQQAFSHATERPLDLASCTQRLAQYAERLLQGETSDTIFDDLVDLLQGVQAYIDQDNYQQALDIYAQVIDSYLAAHEALLITLFDRAIAEYLPQLAILLAEASSLIISEPAQLSDLSELSDPAVSRSSVPLTMLPFLTPEVRCKWLERLFTLWLKRIDMHHIGEQLQEIIFEVAWSEDIPFLRNLVESELQHTSPDIHSHVGDNTRQSRISILEKFLKELPQ